MLDLKLMCPVAGAGRSMSRKVMIEEKTVRKVLRHVHLNRVQSVVHNCWRYRPTLGRVSGRPLRQRASRPGLRLERGVCDKLQFAL